MFLRTGTKEFLTLHTEAWADPTNSWEAVDFLMAPQGLDGARAGTVVDGTRLPDGTIVIHRDPLVRSARWDPFRFLHKVVNGDPQVRSRTYPPRQGRHRCREPALAEALVRGFETF
jgi:hypothetical protein